MSETKNTFEIQLHDSTSPSSALFVYSITDDVASITNPTISASHFSIGDTKVLRGTFKGETTNDFGTLPPYGFSLIITFSNPVFTTIPQVITQVVSRTGGYVDSALSTQVYNKTVNSFSVCVGAVANSYPAGSDIEIDWICMGV